MELCYGGESGDVCQDRHGYDGSARQKFHQGWYGCVHKHPYGIAVNPVTKDIYVTDAKSYVVSGTVYCFSKDGVLKWKQTAGQIPAHFAFKGKIKQ